MVSIMYHCHLSPLVHVFPSQTRAVFSVRTGIPEYSRTKETTSLHQSTQGFTSSGTPPLRSRGTYVTQTYFFRATLDEGATTGVQKSAHDLLRLPKLITVCQMHYLRNVHGWCRAKDVHNNKLPNYPLRFRLDLVVID